MARNKENQIVDKELYNEHSASLETARLTVLYQLGKELAIQPKWGSDFTLLESKTMSLSKTTDSISASQICGIAWRISQVCASRTKRSRRQQ